VSVHIFPLGGSVCSLGCGKTREQIAKENMPIKDPTPRMLEVLRALRKADRPLIANQIAHACGYVRGQDANRHAHDGRAMAPAQRVIFALIGLRKRGLVRHCHRTDGLSGDAFMLTGAGITFCEKYKL